MNCLDTKELALYLSTFGLGETERSAFDRHLAQCKKCREKLTRMKRLLHEQKFENKKACANIREDLEAQAMSQGSDSQREKVIAHVSECHNCNALLSLLTAAFTYEDIGAKDIPISENLAERIERALEQKLGSSQTVPDLRKNKIKEIAQGAKDFVDEIRLSLTPFEPALGFRGTEEIRKSEFVGIEHAGGDLVVNVGLPGVIVELYSNREKYLDDDESDKEGKISFRNIDSGLYKIKVFDHQIDALE